MRILKALLCAGMVTGAMIAAAPAAAQTFRPAVVTTDLSPMESLWHVRVALNVAALGCRDADEGNTVASYNALIRNQSAKLAAASAAVEARYKARYGGRWQSALDGDMTKLYNFFAQPIAQADFCATAKAVLAQIATVDPAQLADFAVDELPALEAPFWSGPRDRFAAEPATTAVVAISAATPVGATLPR